VTGKARSFNTDSGFNKEGCRLADGPLSFINNLFATNPLIPENKPISYRDVQDEQDKAPAK
jgi:hypothetical protein